MPLTQRAFTLLTMLVDDPGACRSRDAILDRLWGIDFETGTNRVDVQVCALRRKLKQAGVEGLIETVRGVGYRLGDAMTS